ncbi:hypothetical protein VPZ60_004282 [Salmonella enterica]|nr:hypothetical protein [Salmonella enterica]
MTTLTVATPKISVRLYKSIMRKPGGEGLPTSQRYADKEAFIDLTPFLGDGSSVTTGKNIGQPCGSFSITFSDKPNIAGQAMGPVLSTAGLESVYGLVEPMDVVEIRMWGGVGVAPIPLPIKMRGFVTEITRGRQMGPDGKPVRTVAVSGQDYGKILQSYQLLYLPSYDGAPALLTGFNFFEQFGGEVKNVLTGAEFITLLLDKAINPLLDTLIPENNGMPRAIKTDLQGAGSVSDSWMNVKGSIYDLMKQYLDIGIWNELFIEDREDGVYLVWRPVPAVDMMTGYAIQELKQPPSHGTIPDNYIVQMRQTRNDNSVYNYYWVTNQRFALVDDNYRQIEALMSGDAQPAMTYPNTASKYYGVRAMYGDSVMTPDDVESVSSGHTENEQEQRSGYMIDWVKDRRRIMMDSNKDNVVLEFGSLEIKGGPTRDDSTEALKSGDYVTVLDGQLKWDAYVMNIQDNFIPYSRYTSTLEFARGTGFARRVSESAGNSPWLKEQARRSSDKADKLQRDLETVFSRNGGLF